MKLKILSLVIISLIFCAACSRNMQKRYDRPAILPSSYNIAVASFTQPLLPAELITGSLGDTDERVSDQDLQRLNSDFQQILTTQTKRHYSFLPADIAPHITFPVSSQTRALAFWLDYGRTHNIDFLLIPQVLGWSEREGSEAGVTKSAEVKLAFSLVDVKNSSIIASSIYEEKQVGLIDNVLTVGEFLKRKGRWVEAVTLAKEGMEQAVREMNL